MDSLYAGLPPPQDGSQVPSSQQVSHSAEVKQDIVVTVKEPSTLVEKPPVVHLAPPPQLFRKKASSSFIPAAATVATSKISEENIVMKAAPEVIQERTVESSIYLPPRTRQDYDPAHPNDYHRLK